MFNDFLFNGGVFNNISIKEATTPQDDVVYNSLGLKNNIFKINNITYWNGHNIESNTWNNPLRDLGGENNYFLREKEIVINGTIKTNTYEELNQQIDLLKKVFAQNGKNLDIKVNGTIRRQKASCINLGELFNINHYNLTFIKYSAVFRAIDEFSYEIRRQSQSFSGQTTDLTEEINYLATAKSEPLINILINSETDLTEISISLGDNSITVADSYQANDVLEIDCENKTVKINSVEVDFDGTFLELTPGLNNYTVDLTGTAFNYDFTISYFNKYL